LSLSQNTWHNECKRRKVDLGSQFGSFHPWLADFIAVRCGKSKTSWQRKAAAHLEAWKQRGVMGWDRATIYPSKPLPVTHFLQPGPIFHRSTTSRCFTQISTLSLD
jgi:hypothetical protein